MKDIIEILLIIVIVTILISIVIYKSDKLDKLRIKKKDDFFNYIEESVYHISEPDKSFLFGLISIAKLNATSLQVFKEKYHVLYNTCTTDEAKALLSKIKNFTY